MKTHRYEAEIVWTGGRGIGTTTYTSYARDHEIAISGKPTVYGSSDPAFHGDPSRYNPEELLVASLSACHMLWYLHLCSVNHVVVMAYIDVATGVMRETEAGGGSFDEVTLHPIVTITSMSDENLARELHREAHKRCFIANSVRFPVRHEPTIEKINGESLTHSQ